MIGTLSDTIAVIVVGIVIVLFAAVGTVGSFTRKENPLEVEVEFRAACAQVNGRAVWNGRHWECLK